MRRSTLRRFSLRAFDVEAVVEVLVTLLRLLVVREPAVVAENPNELDLLDILRALSADR